MRTQKIKSESNNLERTAHQQNALGSFRFRQTLELHHGARKPSENQHEATLREYQMESAHGVA